MSQATAQIIPLFDTAFRSTDQRKADEAARRLERPNGALTSTVWRCEGSGLPRPLVYVLQALLQVRLRLSEVGPSPAYVAQWCRMPPKTAARVLPASAGEQTCQGLGIDPAKVEASRAGSTTTWSTGSLCAGRSINHEYRSKKPDQYKSVHAPYILGQGRQLVTFHGKPGDLTGDQKNILGELFTTHNSKTAICLTNAEIAQHLHRIADRPGLMAEDWIEDASVTGTGADAKVYALRCQATRRPLQANALRSLDHGCRRPRSRMWVLTQSLRYYM